MIPAEVLDKMEELERLYFYDTIERWQKLKEWVTELEEAMDKKMEEAMELMAVKKLGHEITDHSPTKRETERMEYELHLFRKGWEACLEYEEANEEANNE